VDVRDDIEFHEAADLLGELAKERQEKLDAGKGIRSSEMPTLPQNQAANFLSSRKQDVWKVGEQLREKYGIAEGQMLTRAQMAEMLSMMKALPTIPGYEDDIRNMDTLVIQPFGWADRRGPL
jgi:hypothetical protein